MFVKVGIILFVVVIAPRIFAEVLFEGYVKVMLANTHVGFSIQRYEIDNKKKQFIHTNFLKLVVGEQNITEGTKTISDLSYKPISYQYTRVDSAGSKVIDAKIKRSTLTADITEGTKKRRVTLKLPEGVFFSSILGYMLLGSPTGLKTDSRYDYQAIAEEEAGLHKGFIIVEKEGLQRGVKAFKTVNQFKGERWINWVTSKAEVLSSEAPAQGIQAELVDEASEAVGSIGLPTQIVRELFGQVPEGKKNALVAKKLTSPNTPASSNKDK